VVVEGKEAGGHLGTSRSLWEILPEVCRAVKIPVIAAGGIVEGSDIKKALIMGASGVQMGTRFAASLESNFSPEAKELYIKSGQEDSVLIESPVGLPARALRSQFTEKLLQGQKTAPSKCADCLKQCSRSFCIAEALTNAHPPGNISQALIFAGESVGKIKEILSVKEIFSGIIKGASSL